MTYQIREEICLNADRTTIVACDSPQAHFKLSPPNSTLTDEEAVALGLLKEGEAQEPAPAEEPVAVEMGEAAEEAPEKKAQPAAPANKAVAGTANKKK